LTRDVIEWDFFHFLKKKEFILLFIIACVTWMGFAEAKPSLLAFEKLGYLSSSS